MNPLTVDEKIEVYGLWKEAWTKQHPQKSPPTYADFWMMIEIFGFAADEIFG